MRLCRFRSNSQVAVGIAVGDRRIVDVSAAAASAGVSLPASFSLHGIVQAGDGLLDELSRVQQWALQNPDASCVLSEDAVELLHPYRPRKNIVKAGGNARTINGIPNPDAVALLRYHTKAPTAVADPGALLEWESRVTAEVYAEPQLVITIGRPLFFATPEEAQAAVFGYSVGTDFRAWDLMNKHGQWPKAISLDGFFPWGPYIVTADEVADPNALAIDLSLNGDRLLSGNSADVKLSVGEMLAEYSMGIQIEPGDLFMLGTPEAVGFGCTPYRFCESGDVITSSVEGIGSVETPVRIV